MASNAVEARREARKRRILENSENRLQKIFGKKESSLSGTKPTGGERTGSHDIILSRANGNSSTCVENHFNTGNIESAEGLNFMRPSDNYSDNEPVVHEDDIPLNLDQLLGTTLTDKNVFNIIEETNFKPSIFRRIISQRLHVIILALLVKIAFAFNYGFLFGEHPFLPFFVFELTEIIMDKAPTFMGPTSGILKAALLLCGIIPRKVTFISNIFNRTMQIVQNCCLYFFTFVIFYAILEWPG